MRTVRIYQEGNYVEGQDITLSMEASQHIAVVLRMDVGASLTLFNGTNLEFQATIVALQKKKVRVMIVQINEVSRESPLQIHLGQAMSKGDRMEWVIQKSVELGVHRITPLITARCVVKLDNDRMQKKVQQWQAIAVAACEQCGRNIIPLVDHPQHLVSFFSSAHASLKWIVHPEGTKNWRDYPMSETTMALLIGPEGGFSAEEVALALTHHFLPLSLGPRILRTETATISALSLLQAVRGDL